MTIQISNIPDQKKVNGLDFPLVINPPTDSVAKKTSAFHQWLVENKTQLAGLLIKHGAILFRGFPITDAQDFEDMLDQTDYVDMPYVGGAAPRSQVTASRIVTANESPASEKIPFHHEMAQVPSPPGYIFFYSDQTATSGGATSILHSGEICKKLFDINPTFAEKLQIQGVRYQRIMPSVTDKQSAIGRSWKETFKAETREQAEAVMSESGMDWSWQDNGDLKTETQTLPAIRLDPETGQRVFFNSIVAVYSGWNDARNNGATSVFTPDREFMDSQTMAQLIKAMDDLCINFPWHRGDAMWVNNFTTMHARQPFEGERRVLASIAYK